MTIQLALIQDKPRELLIVPIDQLTLSEFNPRHTRPGEDIDKLAERINRNGFEVTRALWAYRNGSGYKIFAGGTRLEAAKQAALTEVPIVLYENLSDQEIVRLAYEDNENDEYHAPVSTVDVWASYAKLAEMGWTQEKIADSVKFSRSVVGNRIRMNELPDEIKKIVCQEFLSEQHLLEIMSLFVDKHFFPWLTTEQVQLELAQKAVQDKSKNGKKSVKAVKEDVTKWKEFIDEAKIVYKSLSNSQLLYNLENDPPGYYFDAQAAFVEELAELGARSKTKVIEAGHHIKLYIKENLKAYQARIDNETQEAANEALKAELQTKLLAKFINGDCLKVLDSWDYGSIKLLFLDPPYGKEYQSNRRWQTNPPEKIKGDTEKEARWLLEEAIRKAAPHLDSDAHILIFCDWQSEMWMRQILVNNDLKLKGSLVWVKEEHSAGDLKGSFGPSHERIIHAVRGSPIVSPRIRDVLEESRSNETEHPTEKPVALLEKLILSTTNESDLVVDLFAGCASILLAAMKTKRDFLGIEIDKNYHEDGSSRLLRELENGK